MQSLRSNRPKIGTHRMIGGICCVLTNFDSKGMPIFRSRTGLRVYPEKKRIRNRPAKRKTRSDAMQVGDTVTMVTPEPGLMGIVESIDPLRVRVTTRGCWHDAILKSPTLQRRRLCHESS